MACRDMYHEFYPDNLDEVSTETQIAPCRMGLSPPTWLSKYAEMYVVTTFEKMLENDNFDHGVTMSGNPSLF